MEIVGKNNQEQDPKERAETAKVLFGELLPLTNYKDTEQHIKQSIEVLETNCNIKSRRVMLYQKKQNLLDGAKSQGKQPNENLLKAINAEIREVNEQMEASDAQYDFITRLAELRRLQRIQSDNEFHFKNVFIARMMAELKECRAQMPEMWSKINELLAQTKHNTDGQVSIIKDLKADIESFVEAHPELVPLLSDSDKLAATEGDTNTEPIERINGLYQNLKRLGTAYFAIENKK